MGFGLRNYYALETLIDWIIMLNLVMRNSE